LHFVRRRETCVMLNIMLGSLERRKEMNTLKCIYFQNLSSCSGWLSIIYIIYERFCQGGKFVFSMIKHFSIRFGKKTFFILYSLQFQIQYFFLSLSCWVIISGILRGYKWHIGKKWLRKCNRILKTKRNKVTMLLYILLITPC
jgi:hypothetical protein